MMNGALKALVSSIGLALLPLAPVRADSPLSEKLLAAMPADVAFILTVERPQHVLPPSILEPIAQAVAPNQGAADLLLDAFKQIPGGFAIGLIPPREFEFKDSADVIVAVSLDRPDASFEDWFEKKLHPALVAISGNGTSDHFKIERNEAGLRVAARENGRTLFAFSTKGRIAFGSNKANRVLRWRHNEYPKKAWINKPGLRSALRRLPKESCIRLLVNPTAIAAAFDKPKPNTPGEIALRLLAPSEFQAIAMDLGLENRAIRLRAAASLAKDCKGIARLLTNPSSESTCLGIFPEDFVAVGRVGWPSARVFSESAFELTDLFDKTIGEEYREDLAAFKTDSRVDWAGGLLGQLVHEAAFGLRVDFTRKNPIGWAAVFPVADATLFNQQLDRLVAEFDLPVVAKERGGLRIRSNAGDPPLAFTVSKNLFLVADSADTILDLARRAGGKGNSSPAGKNLQRCYQALPRPNQLAILLDLELLTKKAPFIPPAAGPRFGPLITQGTVALVVDEKDHVATLELVWDMGRPSKTENPEGRHRESDEGLIVLTRMLSESLVQARQQAKRVVSMSRMRTIGMALYSYAEKHDGAFPNSLTDLLKAQPDVLSLESFENPYDGVGPDSINELEDKSFVIYRAGLSTKSAPDEIVIAEKNAYSGDGANFFFVDGHVQFIQQPRAGELIELIKSGAASVTP